MKKYCFDNSAFSTPLQLTPPDVFSRLWQNVREFISSNQIAVTTEVLDEMLLLPGELGEFIGEQKEKLLLEIGEGEWPYLEYLENVKEMQIEFKDNIARSNQKKGDIGITDISIIALAKTLSLPLISSEKPVNVTSSSLKLKIPNVCAKVGVIHMDFNDFLREQNFDL